MTRNFDFLRRARANQIKLIENHSLDQLNLIPSGMNNNLIWNFAHTLVTQQLLCYGLSGNPMHFTQDIIDGYRKGSKPDGDVDQAFVQMMIDKANSTMDQLVADYESGLFKNFKEYPTSFGVTMTCIEDSIKFNNMHEAMHLGTMLALKNLVK